MTRATEVLAIVEAIRPILARHPAAVQGAALADCLAIWLAGHHVPGDEDATSTMRAELLALHCGSVRELVPVNAKIIGTTPNV
jgi:hypothetical protein